MNTDNLQGQFMIVAEGTAEIRAANQTMSAPTAEFSAADQIASAPTAEPANVNTETNTAEIAVNGAADPSGSKPTAGSRSRSKTRSKKRARKQYSLHNLPSSVS